MFVAIINELSALILQGLRKSPLRAIMRAHSNATDGILPMLGGIWLYARLRLLIALAGVFLLGLLGCGSGSQVDTKARQISTSLTSFSLAPSSSCNASSGAITLSVVASRLTGVAPLAVFFDATATTATATSRPFHDLEYRWDFGDPGSGVWGTTGLSKNTTTGPVATHVFETPGTYNVCLTVFDGTNTRSTSVSITVQDPDAAFPGNRTTCFSNSADFAGCPSGATQVTTSSLDTVTNSATSGNTVRRLLLRRGHVWTASGPTLSAQGPGILGAFGSGAVPIIRSASAGGNTMLTLSRNNTPTMSDWRIMNIEFDGQNRANSYGISAGGGFSQITIFGVNIHDVFSGIQFSPSILNYWNSNGSPGHVIWDQIAVVNSTTTHAIGAGGGYCTYISGSRLSILGNTMDDSIVATHVLRIPYMNKGVIGHNLISRPAPIYHALKLHGPGFSSSGVTGGGRYSEQIVISDNTFLGGAIGSTWTVAIEAQNATEDERIRNVVFERNWTRAGLGTTIGVIVKGSEITFRNNIFDNTGGATGGGTGINLNGSFGIAPPIDQVRIYNNTFYRTALTGDYTGVGLSGSPTNVTIRNNLVSAPGVPIAPALFGGSGGSGFVQSNNTVNNSAAALFVNSSPNVPAGFKLLSTSPAKDVGMNSVPVFSDFFLTNRPLNGVIDRGAAEAP